MARPELTVDRLMKALDHPMKPELQRLRDLVLGADPEITEQVKWNGPSFCWKGDDRVTANVRGKDAVMLVFHRGVKAAPTDDFSFDDPTGLMQWAAKDRAVVTLKSMAEIDRHAQALAELVRRWMDETV
jgi:hypothetical protein